MKRIAATVSRWAVIILAFELKRTLVTPPQPGILCPPDPPDQHSIQRLAFDAKPGLTDQIGARLNRGYVRRDQPGEERQVPCIHNLDIHDPPLHGPFAIEHNHLIAAGSAD